jgi:Arc/MetJ-type ribon-helix-helix transcriptional regulator
VRGDDRRGRPGRGTEEVGGLDLLLELGASRRESADQVIRAALAAMQRDERRRVAAAEARAIKDDPEDRAEIAAIQQDLAALRAGS